jgi:hypothetical protein
MNSCKPTRPFSSYENSQGSFLTSRSHQDTGRCWASSGSSVEEPGQEFGPRVTGSRWPGRGRPAGAAVAVLRFGFLLLSGTDQRAAGVIADWCGDRVASGGVPVIDDSGTARTAPRSLSPAASGLGGWSRATTASSPSPRCGRRTALLPAVCRALHPRRAGCRAAPAIRRSPPSGVWPPARGAMKPGRRSASAKTRHSGWPTSNVPKVTDSTEPGETPEPSSASADMTRQYPRTTMPDGHDEPQGPPLGSVTPTERAPKAARTKPITGSDARWRPATAGLRQSGFEPCVHWRVAPRRARAYWRIGCCGSSRGTPSYVTAARELVAPVHSRRRTGVECLFR